MFVLVGILATTALLTLYSAWSLWIRLLLGAVVVTALFFLWDPVILSRGSSEWWQQPLWRNLLLYVSMLLGMMFRVVWDQLEAWRQSNAQPGAKRKRRPRFEFWEFVYPIMPSLVVFQAVLLFADKEELSLPMVLASFQNGFFWNAVLAKAKQAIETPQKSQ